HHSAGGAGAEAARFGPTRPVWPGSRDLQHIPPLPLPARLNCRPVAAVTAVNQVDLQTVTFPNYRRPPVLDVTASSRAAGGYPIAVGFALDGGRRYGTLITPLPQWTQWDTAAEAAHGIVRAQLFDEGREAHEVARLLSDALAGLTVYSDDWAAASADLSTLYRSTRHRPGFSLRPLDSILSAPQRALWRDVEAGVIRESAPRARSRRDALVVQETWWRTRLACAAAS
ncbi:MAG: hypothetical protein WD928_05975, partial [Gammaproteobacteria bacterium]